MVIKVGQSMFPDEVKRILEKYNGEVAEEISSINLATERIRDALKSVNSFLIGELVSYSKNTEINNLEKESQILKDSQILREYIYALKLLDFRTQINTDKLPEYKKRDDKAGLQEFGKNVSLYVIANNICPTCNVKLIPHEINYQERKRERIVDKIIIGYRCPACNKLFALDIDLSKIAIENTNILLKTEYYNKVSFHDTIVIFNINKCSAHNHSIEDVKCDLPVILPSGKVQYVKVPIIHCKTCKRYIMLKSTYDNLNGVPICAISNETRDVKQHTESDFIYSDKGGSKLYQYGYNVNCSDKLTTEQRHTILLTQLLANNLTKGEIYSILDTNIHNGKMRENSKKDWKNAVEKWQFDKKYVESVDLDLPYERINISRLILKYTK